MEKMVRLEFQSGGPNFHGKLVPQTITTYDGLDKQTTFKSLGNTKSIDCLQSMLKVSRMT